MQQQAKTFFVQTPSVKPVTPAGTLAAPLVLDAKSLGQVGGGITATLAPNGCW